MRRFACPACGREAPWEALACPACGTALAHRPEEARLLALHASRGPCANRAAIGCNWEARRGGALCGSCARTETVPDLGVPGHEAAWARIEGAKRRLLHALHRLRLPLESRGGYRLRFRFLAGDPVTTGHEDGLVTLDVAEADDARREARRASLGERYRTLLGHLRHEAGHFFFDVLVEEGGERAAFDALFGDPGADYGAALGRHYAEGPPPGWEASHLTAYAAAHPWEDWAETFAHWLHVADGLETAAAWGLAAAPDPYAPGPVAPLLDAWAPLGAAMDAMGRALGHAEWYPFAHPPPVRAKLGLVHRLVTAGR